MREREELIEREGEREREELIPGILLLIWIVSLSDHLLGTDHPSPGLCLSGDTLVFCNAGL